MQERRNFDTNPFGSIFGILALVLFFVALFFIAQGIFKILAFLAPILLVATIFIDYTVILSYGKWLLNLLRKDLLLGIGGVLLTVFGFPVIAGFLFGKALLYKKLKKMNREFERENEPEFAEYEEIEDETPPELELPPLEKKEKSKKSGNDYEKLFDDDH